jgi:chemotaxis protein methyltransferase CheR
VSISRREFDYVRRLVREQCGLALEPGKEYLVETRLHMLALRECETSIQDLLRRVRSDSSGCLQRKVSEAMLTAETTFFRDVRPFEILRKVVLPELLTRRADSRSLNLWCAASSGGQEPYSVAMLLREFFPVLAHWKVRFIASDFSRELLDRARDGIYSQLEVNRGLPAALLVKYFRKVAGGWQLSQDIRRMVEFQEINLAGPWPPLPPIDVVFMRNVLIYFGADTRKSILDRVRSLLEPDGYVFLGGSETMTKGQEGFEPIPSDVSACFRLAGAPIATRT